MGTFSATDEVPTAQAVKVAQPIAHVEGMAISHKDEVMAIEEGLKQEELFEHEA